MVLIMINRCLDLQNLLNKSSHFLFGARNTGKSWLIRKELEGKADIIDLLHSKIYLRLKARPEELETMIRRSQVAIDEIQRIPELLNEVHRLIEEKGIRFLLTGSSARKIKRKDVNLLAGRAYKAEMLPLTWFELEAENRFNLRHYLQFGGLPQAYPDDTPQEFLYAYVDTYLKEEIQAEALVRNLSNYHRFLTSAAISNAEIINYTKIANDAQVSPNTVRDYFQILEDTLIAFQLPPWLQSRKRKAIQTAKFYFFDIGVVHSLREIEVLDPVSDLFGKAFEQFIVMEVRAFVSYRRLRKTLSYWRSTSQFEVDLVIGNEIAIEIKAASRITERDNKGLKAICEEQDWKHLILVSQDHQERHYDNGITHLHWKTFLQKLWNREFI